LSRLISSALGDKALLCVAATAFACFDNRPATAQEASNTPVLLPEVSVNGSAAAQPYELNLNRPSTAASRLNLTPLQTPASVTIVPGDQIRYQGDRTVADAISRAVGFTQVPFTGNGGNSFSARGFYGQNSITQLYDGMQLFNAGGVVTFPFDPWNIDRIEVLSGSSSSLYGTGGVGGAINVVPKDPNWTKQTTMLQASAGSFRTYHGAAEITGPITPRLSYLFDISQYRSGGWTSPNGDSHSLAMSGALRYELMPEFIVTLRDDYGNINPSTYEGTPTFNGRAIEGLRYTNYNVNDGYIAFRENRLFLKEAWQVNPNISFTNNTYLITQYRRYHEGATFAYVPATQSVTRTMFRDINGDQTQYGDHGFTTISFRPLGLDNQTVMGFDVNRSTYNRWDNQTGGSTGSSTVNAYAFNPGTFQSTGATAARPQYILLLDQMGVFAEDRLSLTDQLSLVAGVRGDHYETNLQTFPSYIKYKGIYDGPGYHAGLVYNPLPNVTLYGRYSVSTDPVTSLASAGASNIAFGLSPARQIEIGAKGMFLDDRLQATIALYDIVKKNLLTPTLANSSISETVGQQSSRGIEATASYKVTDDILIEANGTILTAKFDFYNASLNGGMISLAGYRPQFVPTKTANVLAHWTFMPGWDLRGAVRFVGDRFADNTDLYRLPAYTVLDIGLRWNATHNLNLDLRINNVTDRAYAISTYAGNGTQLILGEPRSVTGTMNLTF